MKKQNRIPKFKNENEESKFWSVHDSVDYFDWSKSKKARFPNLKPTSKSIPIRFPKLLIERLKILANKQHVPYQSLLKTFLEERVEKELHHSRTK
jgi:predicted DNA binding CopG/RHH family protein